MAARGRAAHLAVLVVVLAGAGCSEPQPAGTPTVADTLPDTLPDTRAGDQAIVAYVNDGDTLRTTSGESVRLVQIDAPEVSGECHGKAALVALRRLAPPGTRVTLVRDPALDATDRNGRLLRYVFTGGRNVNLALVREGAASPYFFRQVRGSYAAELLRAARAARSVGRGLWGACPGAKLNPGLGSATGPA